jgi:cytochrome c oxidase accessory protein FixG
MREQICTYICPYGRFQSVMYEAETLAVHYDAARGEAAHGRASVRAGRGIVAERRSRECADVTVEDERRRVNRNSGERALAERHAQGLGDCIDCGLCVQVCPVGIDIRDGLQYKCISCGLCVDACNTIMDSFGFPRGLIRYDSEKNLALPTPVAPKLHWKRLKIIGYGVALVLMSAYLVYSINTRGSFDRAVSQVRQPLYVVLTNGDIRNRYQVRITNKAAQDQTYQISARGIPAAALDLGHFREISIKPGHSGLVQASVHLPPALAAHTQHFEMVITPLGKPEDARAEVIRFDMPSLRP